MILYAAFNLCLYCLIYLLYFNFIIIMWHIIQDHHNYAVSFPSIIFFHTILPFLAIGVNHYLILNGNVSHLMECWWYCFVLLLIIDYWLEASPNLPVIFVCVSSLYWWHILLVFMILSLTIFNLIIKYLIKFWWQTHWSHQW